MDFENSDKYNKLLDKYQYFLFDCDGVLWNQTKTIPGAVELIQLLVKLGKQV